MDAKGLTMGRIELGSGTTTVAGVKSVPLSGLPPHTQPYAPTTPGGLKFDGGKPRFSLLRFGMARALEGVARVLTFGAKKYAAHSWREVEDGVDRYWSAMERHLNEIAKHGEDSRDEESGELHIDHVATNVLFLSELIRSKHNITA